MLKLKKESIEWLEFELFQEISDVRHATFLRHGGISCAPCDTLNLGGGTVDTESNIALNRRKVQDLLHCSSLVGCYEVHGKRVVEVSLKGKEEKCDALVTIQPGVGLLIT